MEQVIQLVEISLPSDLYLLQTKIPYPLSHIANINFSVLNKESLYISELTKNYMGISCIVKSLQWFKNAFKTLQED